MARVVMLRCFRSVRVYALPLCLGLCGCELGQSLKEIGQVLGGSEVETVDGEGEALISGHYYSLRFDGNNPDGVFVVALEALENDPNRLVLVPFPDGTGDCSPGPASRYGPAKSRPGREEHALEARIPFVSRGSDTEAATLRFTNFACDVDSVEVPDSSMPLDSDFAATPGFIAQTSTGELYFVSPWEEQLDQIAKELTPIARTNLAMFAQGPKERWMWTIESGRLVARDNRFKVRGRTGEGVDQVQHLASTRQGPMLAYHQANDEIYTVLASDLSAPTLIDEDACSFALSTGLQGPRLLYYSPCAEQNLVMYELESQSRTVIAEHVANYRVVDERSDGPVVLYLEAGGPSTVIGKLWARFGQQPPVPVGDNGHLGLTRLNGDGLVKAVLDWGDLGGALRAGQLGEDLTELATDVVYYSSFGVIGDWNGTTGTLYQFDDTGEQLVKVTKHVATAGIRYDTNTKRGLVLVDFDGQEGELTMIRDGKATPLTKNVRPDSYQFTVQLPTVTVLSDLDPETGSATLRLRDTETDSETVVSEGVSEVLEVSWPTAGLLYSVPVGERAGIWFTEAH
jgi:hypothetical protein